MVRKNKPKLSDYDLTQADVNLIEKRSDYIENIGGGLFSLIIAILLLISFIFLLFKGPALSFLLPLLGIVVYFGILLRLIEFFLTKFFDFKEGFTTSKNIKYEKYSSDKWDYDYKEKKVIEELRKAELRKEELKQKKIRDLKRKTFQFWINLDPYKFEHEITELFIKNGFIAKTTKGSGDGGIDIFLNKNNRKGIAQCKKQKTRVSPSVIRDIYGTMISGKFNFAYVICPAGFSNESVSFAKGKKIILIGLKRIMEMNNEEVKDIKFLNIK